MKRNLYLLLMATVVLFSCSEDKETADAAATSILGTWDLTALEIDEATATDDMEMGEDLLNFLTALDCYIVTLTFNEDLSLLTENSANYIQINVNPGGTGLDVPCPTEKDMDTTVYTYENGVLTFIDDNQETVTVAVVITGDTMVMSAEAFGVDNFDTGGDLVFMRR